MTIAGAGPEAWTRLEIICKQGGRWAWSAAMKLREFYHQTFRAWHLRASIARLRRLEDRLQSPHTRLAVPFLYRGYGGFRHIRPMQSQWELGELFTEVCQQRPGVVLEIGTCHGGTLYLWCQAARPDACVLSLDLPEGEFGGGYSPRRSALYRAFAQAPQTLHLLRADSHAPATLQEVRRVLAGRRVDFLFIDGDHTYAGVRQDFELYESLVAPGGLIALHDVHPRRQEPRIEVWKFWEELRATWPPAAEWIDPTPAGRAIGIGLLRKPA